MATVRRDPNKISTTCVSRKSNTATTLTARRRRRATTRTLHMFVLSISLTLATLHSTPRAPPSLKPERFSSPCPSSSPVQVRTARRARCLRSTSTRRLPSPRCGAPSSLWCTTPAVLRYDEEGEEN